MATSSKRRRRRWPLGCNWCGQSIQGGIVVAFDSQKSEPDPATSIVFCNACYEKTYALERQYWLATTKAGAR